jgi:protein kinase C substrate 80K-H
MRNILDDLRKGYNPNYQDMAVKAAVVGYEELTGLSTSTVSNSATDGESEAGTGGAEGSEGSEADKEAVQAEQKEEVERVSEWELDQAERKDLEGLLLEDMDAKSAVMEDEEGSTGLCELAT